LAVHAVGLQRIPCDELELVHVVVQYLVTYRGHAVPYGELQKQSWTMECEDGSCSMSAHFITIVKPTSPFSRQFHFWMELRACK
jgi:hypothetical protein